jgi:hypothetical protein
VPDTPETAEWEPDEPDTATDTPADTTPAEQPATEQPPAPPPGMKRNQAIGRLVEASRVAVKLNTGNSCGTLSTSFRGALKTSLPVSST